jgi:hypothetical protein
MQNDKLNITPALKGVKNILTNFELPKAPFRAGGVIIET